MRTTLRKSLALLLAVLMFLTSGPISALAAVVSGSITDTQGFSLRNIADYKYTLCVSFMVDGSLYARQYVLNDEILLEPDVPVKPGYKFVGWYDADGQQPSFGTQTVTADTSVTYTASYVPVKYVFYHDVESQNYRVIATRELTTGDTIATNDVPLAVSAEQKFDGWYTDQGLSTAAAGSYSFDSMTGNVDLYAKVLDGHWLTFNVMNGTPIEPAFYTTVEKTVEPEKPTRNGYEFLGWYTDEACTSKFTFGDTISGNQTLFANWKVVDKAPYTIIYWKQKVTDDKNAAYEDKTYDYAESRVVTDGEVNEWLNPADFANKSYEGFIYKSDNTQNVSVQVKSDGSTILNVYYDRQLITMYFKIRQNGSWQNYEGTPFTGLHGQTLAQNGYTWPSGRWWYDDYKEDWGQYQGDGTRMTFLDAFLISTNDGKDTQTYYGFEGSGTKTIIHYKQNVDNENKWDEAIRTASSSERFTFSNKYDGFTCSVYSTNGSNWSSVYNDQGTFKTANGFNTLHVRYTRNSYSLSFLHGAVDEDWDGSKSFLNTAAAATASVKYEESLSSYEVDGETVVKPDVLPDYYVLYKDGNGNVWFANPECTTPFDFSGKMDKNNVVVYCKWIAPIQDVTITFDNGIDADDEQTVKAGELAKEPDEPQKSGYKFAGWIVKDTGKPFSFSTPITKDITISAAWIAVGTYEVTYEAVDAMKPTDNVMYAGGSYAEVKAPLTYNYTDDANGTTYYFVSWTSGGNTYYPGDKILINNDTKLTANYTTKQAMASLTYTPGEGTGTVDNDNYYYINEPITLLRAKEDLNYSKTGYSFAGWSDGSNTYEEGAKISLNSAEEHVLTALWTPDAKKYTVEFYYMNDNGVDYTLLETNERESVTDAKVAVTKEDKQKTEGSKYILNESESTLEGIIPATGTLTLKLYFDLNEAEYTINHYLKGSMRKVADSVTGKATVGTEIEAIPVDGVAQFDSYSDPKITISATGDNVINVYYTLPITITAATDKWTYDGNAHENNSVTVTAGTLFEGDRLVAAATGSVTYVGDTAKGNNPIAKGYQIMHGDTDVTADYVITPVAGTLTIIKMPVTVEIEGKRQAADYDGDAHTADGYNVISISDPLYNKADIKLSGSAIATRTEVGTTNMGLTVDQFTNTNDNFQVTFVVKDGYQTINPIDVTVYITGNTSTVTYDGKEHSVTGYGVAISNPLYTAADFTFNGAATATRTEVGTTYMGLVADQFTNKNNNFKTVTFDVTDGQLEINPVEKVTVTITENSDTVTYDGKEHTISGYKSMVSDNPLYNVTTSVKATETEAWTVTKVEAGTYDMGIVADDFENTNLNFAEVEFVIVDGQLVINRTFKELKIVSGSTTWTYDGQSHSYPEYTVTYADAAITQNEDGTYTLSTGDAITITCTSSVKYVKDTGIENNKFTYVLENASQYANVSVAYGDLEITERPITITADSATKTYDAKPLTDDGWKDTAPANVAETDKVESVKVKGSQTLVGSSKNVASNALIKNEAGDNVTENYKITYVDGKLTVTGDPIDPPAKEEDNKSSEYKADEYQLGDKIPFTITVHNVTTEPIEGITVTDETAEIVTYEDCGYTVSEDKHTATIAKLESDATVIVKALHTVTSDDILKGDYENKVTVKTPGNKEFKADKTVDKIDSPDTTLEVLKKSDVAEGAMVELGQTVTYTITVTNKGNVPFYNVTVDEDLKGLQITKVTGNSYEYTIDNELRRVVLEQLPVGETVTITATYVATSDDILVGKITNNVTATAKPVIDPDKPNEPKIPTDTDKEEDETDDLDTDLTVTKKTTTTKDVYALGDTIEYEITVKNDGNVPFYNVEVVDEKTEATWTIDVLKVGEEKTFTTSYTVTEDDILAGTVVNEVVAEADEIKDPKDPEHPKTPKDDDKVEDETDDLNSKLTVEKKTAAKQDAYKLGETIKYEITVKNDGNVPFYNVVVDDTLEGAVITADEAYEINEAGNAVIADLIVGETVTVYAQYTVTSDDILKGEVVNSVTAKADPIPDPKDPENPKTPEDGDDEKDITDDIIDTLTVTKETTNEGTGENGMYKLGETITYDITVKNDGNVPYYNVVVTDELENAEIVAGEGYSINANGQAVVTELAVGASVVVKAQYTVTSDDILAGKVINDATAKADPIDDPKNPDTPKQPEGDDDEEDETDDIIDKLTVTKETTNEGTGENGMYKLGETITYDITVKNDGNVPYYNVVVTDELENAEIVAGEGYTINENGQAVIAELAVGASVVVKAQYTVTSDDILAGKVINDATAKADPIDDPKNPDTPKQPEGEDDVEDETDDIIDKLTVTKETTNEGTGENGMYKLGETITYDITVKNDGNVPYYNVVVTDELENAEIVAGEGYTINENGQAVIAELAVGASVVVKAQYTVISDDILAGKVINDATAKADPIDDPKNPDTPKQPEGDDDEEDETDDVIDKLTVTKETTNEGTGKNGMYKLGETITYDITVKNDGNVPYYNVVVTDELENAEIVAGEGYSINENGQAVIAELAVGASVVVKAQYTVTSDDILAGKVINDATAKADPIDDPKNPDEPKQPEGDDDADDETEDLVAAMSLVKVTTSTAANEDGDYRLGEIITYDITVKNDGNVPYYNVVVTDELIDATILEGAGYTIDEEGKAVIAVLAVGESITVKAEYEVAENDILAGTVVNNATAAGDPIVDPKNPDEPKVPTDEDDEENTTHTHYDYKVEHYLETEEEGVFEETPYETDEYKDVKFADPAVYEANDYEEMGFHYEATLDDVPSATVPANDDLVIKLYYPRRTDLQYTIEFYYEESIGQTPAIYVQSDEHPDVVVENARFSNVIDETTEEVAKAIEENLIYNYELGHVVGTTVTLDVENNIVSVYYDRQKTEYTVEYYYDGDIDYYRTEVFEGICGQEINGVTPKPKEGYKLELVSPNKYDRPFKYDNCFAEDAKLVLCEDEDENVIRLYYRQQYTTYRVFYYYDGVLDESRIFISEPRPQATIINEYPSQLLPGYKLDHVEGLPCKLNEHPVNNQIHVYYVSDAPTEIVIPTGSGSIMSLNVGECCE